MNAITPKWTNGPWRIAGKGTIRAGDGWIADIHWRNREENARLIAAAPDLAEALLAIVNAQTDLLHVGYDDAPGGGNYVYADAIRTDNPAFELARAALRKAGAL